MKKIKIELTEDQVSFLLKIFEIQIDANSTAYVTDEENEKDESTIELRELTKIFEYALDTKQKLEL